MMLTGAATKLESQFRLKWNMILNLLRVEDMSVPRPWINCLTDQLLYSNSVTA